MRQQDVPPENVLRDLDGRDPDSGSLVIYIETYYGVDPETARRWVAYWRQKREG